MNAQPTPDRIMQTGMAFWNSKTLLSAVELNLFSTLADKALTGAELTQALKLHNRANPDFFDALVSLQLLERDGDGPTARYRNTAETALFLDKAKPTYVGGILEMANSRLFRFWADLTQALKTGKPQNETRNGGDSVFDELYADPARLEQFVEAMSGVSTGNFMALAEKFDFSKYKTLCDVGGAAGILSIMVATRHKHMRCTSTDLPKVCAIANRKIASYGLSDRIETRSLDFFNEPIPAADVITMGMILHDWDLKNKMMLIRKAYDALPVGGAFIAIEAIIDDARRQNTFGIMMSLNMLIEFGVAFDYTGADFTRWCKEVGFKRTEIIPLAGPSSAAVAYK
jgi:predicted O-methyltransferase YrrM